MPLSRRFALPLVFLEDIKKVATGIGYRITAWLKLIFKCPYKIGQRVIMACVEGGVVEMTLAHVVHSKVGRTLQAKTVVMRCAAFKCYLVRSNEHELYA